MFMRLEDLRPVYGLVINKGIDRILGILNERDLPGGINPLPLMQTGHTLRNPQKP
jgi:hypothetical protein